MNSNCTEFFFSFDVIKTVKYMELDWWGGDSRCAALRSFDGSISFFKKI